jgi:hypothetical protein
MAEFSWSQRSSIDASAIREEIIWLAGPVLAVGEKPDHPVLSVEPGPSAMVVLMRQYRDGTTAGEPRYLPVALGSRASLAHEGPNDRLGRDLAELRPCVTEILPEAAPSNPKLPRFADIGTAVRPVL